MVVRPEKRLRQLTAAVEALRGPGARRSRPTTSACSVCAITRSIRRPTRRACATTGRMLCRRWTSRWICRPAGTSRCGCSCTCPRTPGRGLHGPHRAQGRRLVGRRADQVACVELRPAGPKPHRNRLGNVAVDRLPLPQSEDRRRAAAGAGNVLAEFRRAPHQSPKPDAAGSDPRQVLARGPSAASRIGLLGLRRRNDAGSRQVPLHQFCAAGRGHGLGQLRESKRAENRHLRPTDAPIPGHVRQLRQATGVAPAGKGLAEDGLRLLVRRAGPERLRFRAGRRGSAQEMSRASRRSSPSTNCRRIGKARSTSGVR